MGVSNHEKKPKVLLKVVAIEAIRVGGGRKEVAHGVGACLPSNQALAPGNFPIEQATRTNPPEPAMSQNQRHVDKVKERSAPSESLLTCPS